MLAVRKSWALALITAVLSVSPARASITYNVDTTMVVDTLGIVSSVSGAIVTDGILGPLGASDIVSYKLLLTDYNGTFTLSNTAGSVVVGSGLSASSTSLTFNFSGASDVFYISQGGSAGLCFQGSSYNCNGSFYPPPGEAMEIGVGEYGHALPYTPVSGTGVIATTGVPEPSTWAMMLLGFVGLGYAGYRGQSRQYPARRT